MQKSIYILIYSTSGAFLIAQRMQVALDGLNACLSEGSETGSQPAGVAGFYALPGGPTDDVDWLSDDALIAEARRLLTARCGRQISFHGDAALAVQELEMFNLPINETLVRFFDTYRRPTAAYYLGLPDALFDVVHKYLSESLSEQFSVIRAVSRGEASLGDLLLEEALLHAPMEASLRSVEIWDHRLDADRIALLDEDGTRPVFQIVSHLPAMLPESVV